MDELSKSGMGPPKRSLDEIIENMTADLHDSDGQYIQLGFTPPPTPATPQHHWTPHSYLPPMTQPVYLPEHIAHPNEQPPFLNSRSHSQSSLGGLIPGREMPEGNFVNLVYGSPVGLYVLNESTPPGMQQNIILNNYVPYRENDYGSFMNTPAQHSATPQPPAERNSALIDHLVGNWSSTGSGTYSPFGNGSSPERMMESPIQPLPPQPIPEERVIPKKRIVAEVRPMRPSYSDIVSKSPPTKTRTLSPNITKNATEINVVKPVKVSAKCNKALGSKKTASSLKRQHSGEEVIVQKITSESARSQSPTPMVFTRRVSLDDLDDLVQGEEDEERPDSAQDSSSQSGDNSGKTGETAKGRSARNGECLPLLLYTCVSHLNTCLPYLLL